MKYLKLICSSILFASGVLAEENEPKALPDIPTLNIDAQKQSKPQTSTNPVNQESQSVSTLQNSNSTPTQGDLKNIPTTSNTTDILQPLTEDNVENNETKRGRDPFTPIITPKASGQITNAPQLDLFTKTELILPSTARKIKKIILEYQNLNGSITSIEQNLEGDIDWHFPLILSQEVQPKAQNIVDKQSFTLSRLFEFEITKQNIKFKTSLKRLRDFTLASPTRLVLDFKAPDKTPLQEIFDTQIPSIPKVSLSTHLDFYRITFNFDGQYKYKIIQNSARDYTIELY
ncbi:AMIN domain-containing protein [uncultured Helicobacter sp.]|uniref:AMIN domain-containing protein n=1 Tax=uncultured Helicobacter sp. TaxID=175537 RepID=UPI0026174B11|nr:AMIN domain-containing protein [uncultured Helicobacter sp.]